MSVLTAVDDSPGRYLRGSLFVLAAGMSWSFTGVFVRLAPDLTAWQFLTWRCVGMSVAFALIHRARGHRNLIADWIALGLPGLLVSVSLFIASVSYIVAMKTTTVANAIFLSSCSPLMSSVLGYLVLGERLGRPQIGAVALGFVGLLIIVGGGVEAGNPIGNLCAIASALGFAVSSVTMRKSGGRDYMPAMFGFGLFGAALAASMCMSQGTGVFGPYPQAVPGFFSGFLLMGLGFFLFLRGAPFVPAVGQTVLAQTETVFGPIWVWLAFGEQPTLATLTGGATIFVAVLGMAAAGGRPNPVNISN